MSSNRLYLAVLGVGASVPMTVVGDIVSKIPDEQVLRHRRERSKISPEDYLKAVREFSCGLIEGDDFYIGEEDVEICHSFIGVFREFVSESALKWNEDLDICLYYDECSPIDHLFITLEEYEKYADLTEISGSLILNPPPQEIGDAFSDWSLDTFGCPIEATMYVHQTYKYEYE